MLIKPMLLSSREKAFSSPDYLFEWKVDGVRCIAHIDQGRVQLFSRHGKNCTAAFPELWGIGRNLKDKSAILDGELCALVDNKPDFEAVMKRYMARSPRKVQEGARYQPVTFVVWDILSFNGQYVTKLPLVKRKELLGEVVATNDNLQVINSVDGEGETLFAAVCTQGLEGMVAKKKDSTYLLGERSSNWLKIKNWRVTDCYITGYKPGEPGIYLGLEQSGGVRPAGIATYGMQPDERAALMAVARDIEIKRELKAVWLEPVIKCRVKHVGVTSNRILRDAIFLNFIA